MPTSSRLLLTLGALPLLGLLASPAAAAPPPVDVEVVAEDEADFFTRKSPAQDAFEELSEEEQRSRVKVKKGQGEGNQNVNTNVINVVVTPEQAVKAEAKPDVKVEANAAAKPEVKVEQKPAAAQPAAAAPAGALVAAEQAPPPRGSWAEWWYREDARAFGDILLGASFGGGEGGYGYGGLTGEALLSDWAGLRVGALVGFYGAHGHHGRGRLEPPEDFDLFSGSGRLGPDPASLGSVDYAIMHLEELSFVVHIGGRDGGFDLFPSVGLAHYGYHVKGSEETAQGGSGLGRVGLGLGYFYHRFFAAFEVAWYPVELFRYDVKEERVRDFRVSFEEGEARSAGKRYTGAFTVGISL